MSTEFNHLKSRIPYGMWRCANGREVMFNREYNPIFQKMPGEGVTAAKPKEFVLEIVFEGFFFVDGEHPEIVVFHSMKGLMDWIAGREPFFSRLSNSPRNRKRRE